MTDALQDVIREDPDAVWAEVVPLWHSVRGSEDHLDVGFYMKLVAAAGHPTVELGIGYGRVARWTHPDFGVDASIDALRRCVQRVPGTVLVNSRPQDYVLSERASLTYAPHNRMALLGGTDEVLDALECIRRNTRRGGRLAFDLTIADWDRIRDQLDHDVVHGQVGALRLVYRPELVSVDHRHEHGSLLMHHSVERLDAQGRVRSRTRYPAVAVHYFSPRRWRHMLVRTGWRIERSHGGFSGQPLNPGGRHQVWLARR